jgi:hypothetical protein
MTRSGWAATIVLFAAACGDCAMCGGEDAIAELFGANGEVQRDRATAVGTWEGAAVGATFGFGDGLRTRVSSRAKVRFSGGGEMRVGEQSTVRFLRTAPDANERGIGVETGEVEIEAGGVPLRLRTGVGVAVLEPSSTVRIRGQDGALRFTVSVGAATLETGAGETALTAGQGIVVDIGGAVLERFGSTVAPADPDAGPPPPPPARDAGAARDAGPPDTGAPAAAPGEIAATVRGGRAQIRAPGTTSWNAVASGATVLQAGSGVRVGRGVSMDVVRGEERGTLIGSGEYVVGTEDGALVRAISGRVEIAASSRDVVVRAPGGTIVARGGGDGSAARIELARGETQVRAESGTVELRGRGGVETLRAGERGTLGGEGEVEVAGRGPERVHLTVGAGESFTVRDPAPPTAIAFRIGSVCGGPGTVQLMRGSRPGASSAGTGTASLMVPPGSHRYRVRCEGRDGDAASGTIRVMRDSGQSRLPSTPPATVVDTDGRRYTVLYQNLLPQITVRWTGVEPSGRYVLRVSGPGGTQNVSTSGPRHAFPPGALGEGSHTLVFASPAGGAADRSRETTLSIRFDNAAPSASLREPANGSFAPGATVGVAGVALEGWSVTVNGGAIQLDEQHRFRGTAAVPGDAAGIAIRLAHPRRGVHYYIRRTGS